MADSVVAGRSGGAGVGGRCTGRGTASHAVGTSGGAGHGGDAVRDAGGSDGAAARVAGAANDATKSSPAVGTRGPEAAALPTAPGAGVAALPTAPGAGAAGLPTAPGAGAAGLPAALGGGALLTALGAGAALAAALAAAALGTGAAGLAPPPPAPPPPCTALLLTLGVQSATNWPLTAKRASAASHALNVPAAPGGRGMNSPMSDSRMLPPLLATSAATLPHHACFSAPAVAAAAMVGVCVTLQPAGARAAADGAAWWCFRGTTQGAAVQNSTGSTRAALRARVVAASCVRFVYLGVGAHE